MVWWTLKHFMTKSQCVEPALGAHSPDAHLDLTNTTITSGTRKDLSAQTSGVAAENQAIVGLCGVQDREATSVPMLLLWPFRLPSDPSRREMSLLLSPRHRLRPLRIRTHSHTASAVMIVAPSACTRASGVAKACHQQDSCLSVTAVLQWPKCDLCMLVCEQMYAGHSIEGSELPHQSFPACIIHRPTLQGT